MKELSIEYCGICNYRPIATVLARAIATETGAKTTLIHSHDIGAFEVRADGNLIFSKKKSGRFPEHSEIIEILKKSKPHGKEE